MNLRLIESSASQLVILSAVRGCETGWGIPRNVLDLAVDSVAFYRPGCVIVRRGFKDWQGEGSLIRIHCVNCGEPILADDIDLGRALAKCRKCHAVFPFGSDVSRRRAVPRGETPVPRGVVVEEMGARLRITGRWFSKATIALLVFCVVWDGFLVFWYTAAFKEGAPLIMKIFPLLHVLVGLVITYGALCSLFNRTTIEAVGGYLDIRHGPLPAAKNHHIETHKIAQLYATEKMHRSHKGHVSYTYKLWAKLANGERIKLIKGIAKPEHAIFFEQQIERYLGIRDEPEEGELPR